MKEQSLSVKNMNLLKLQRYQQHDENALVRLGTKSWESVKYCGTLYDHDTPIEEFLSIYASQYDSVEYVDSFTDLPSERRVKALRTEVESVNENFQFCPLIPRRISHEFTLGENKFDLEEFVGTIQHLGKHLGPCILRLPETFAPKDISIIFRFLKLWPAHMRLSIHATGDEWYRRPDSFKELVKGILGSNISILIEDRMEQPLNPEKILCSDHLIVRFFGRPGLGQDEQRLAMWVYKLGEFKGYGIKNPYFLLYEQEEMCLSILRKLAQAMGGKVHVPESFDVNSKQLGFGL